MLKRWTHTGREGEPWVRMKGVRHETRGQGALGNRGHSTLLEMGSQAGEISLKITRTLTMVTITVTNIHEPLPRTSTPPVSRPVPSSHSTHNRHLLCPPTVGDGLELAEA